MVNGEEKSLEMLNKIKVGLRYLALPLIIISGFTWLTVYIGMSFGLPAFVFMWVGTVIIFSAWVIGDIQHTPEEVNSELGRIDDEISGLVPTTIRVNAAEWKDTNSKIAVALGSLEAEIEWVDQKTHDEIKRSLYQIMRELER